MVASVRVGACQVVTCGCLSMPPSQIAKQQASLATNKHCSLVLEKLLRGDSFGKRKGAAYGLAAAVRGLGLASLKSQGIMPALESSHAVAYAEKLARQMDPEQMIVVNLSGRGDKDILTVAEIDGITL